MKHLPLRLAAALLTPLVLGPLAPAAQAQDDHVSEGTYQIDGGGYQITVERQGADLVVVEPNKRSVYARQADGTWHFLNRNNGILYGIRRVDSATIEAFKPDQPNNVPTRLARVGGAPAVKSAELPPSVAATDPASIGEVALKYRELTMSDPDNAQAWTACAAAALKRHTANIGEADAYGAQMATVLKTIITDPTRSPCPDAIPETVWAAGNTPPDATPVVRQPTAEEIRTAEEARRAAEEAARVAELNRLADQRAKAQEAERQRQLAEHAKAIAEAQAAQAQFERDRQSYEDAKAKADAAAAAYRRQIEDYERTYGRKP
jgi:hypothetical protein